MSPLQSAKVAGNARGIRGVAPGTPPAFLTESSLQPNYMSRRRPHWRLARRPPRGGFGPAGGSSCWVDAQQLGRPAFVPLRGPQGLTNRGATQSRQIDERQGRIRQPPVRLIGQPRLAIEHVRLLDDVARVGECCRANGTRRIAASVRASAATAAAGSGRRSDG